MKTKIFSALAALTLSTLPPIATADDYLRDDFDYYPSGTLINGEQWSTSVPGTGMRWTTSPQGSMAITGGSALGRSGNLFRFSVEHSPSSPDNRSFSSIRLNPTLTSQETWTLSLDFYIESLPAEGGPLTLVTLFNSATATAAYRISYVTLVPQLDGTVRALMVMGHKYDNPLTKTFEVGFLDMEKWYTLTITGNNESRLLSGNISGEGFSASTDQGFYASTQADRLQQIALGSFGEGPSGNTLLTGESKTVYVDNVHVQTIPEPGTVALAVGAVGMLAVVRLRVRFTH